jgi:putative transcriptional regulator
MRMSSVRSIVAAALIAAAAAAQAQVPSAGSLLVATPELADPNFTESVLLMVHHDDNGSIGVLVNRPTNLDPASVFPDVPLLDQYDGKLYLGGPVAPSQLLLLLRAAAAGRVEGPPLIDDVYVSADPGVLEDFPEPRIDATLVRLYAGHATWGPGQLEDEIARGDWHVVAGRAELVFTREPLELWRQVERSTEGLVARSSAPQSDERR